MTDPLGLIDLTSLNDDDTADTIRALVAKSQGVAALCVMPGLVAVARSESPLPVATVANFPHATGSPDAVAAACREAIAEGADEVDVVIPWAEGPDVTRDLVARCSDAVDGHVLKVILETGCHPDAETTRALAQAAAHAGADFLKTSTGKVGAGATPEAAAILLEVAAEHGIGVKVSGGIRTKEDAEAYVAQAEAAFGEPVTAERFRIGASSLVDALR